MYSIQVWNVYQWTDLQRSLNIFKLLFIVLAVFDDIEYNIMYNVNEHTNFIYIKKKKKK